MSRFTDALLSVRDWFIKSDDAEPIPDPKGFALDMDTILARTGNASVLIKPSRISFNTLRLMSRSNAIVRLCIDTIKHMVARTSWQITTVDDDEDPETYQDKVDILSKLLQRPNENNETFRTLMEKIIEDLLALDQADIEIVRNPNGDIVELYALDGATMRPVYDRHGQYLDPAYLQFLPGNKSTTEADASFGMADIIHMMQNPQTDVKLFGYGYSPIEAIIGVATNYLNADLYQGDQFEKGTFADIMLNVGENTTPAQLNEFREYWKTEIAGRGHSLPIVGGSKSPEVLKLRQSPKDAQFMEYTQWLARIIVGAFGLSPQDIGLNLDQYKAEGEVQAQLSNKKAYSSILDTIAEYINQEIIWEGFGENDEVYKKLKFCWTGLDEVNAKERAEVAKIDISIGARTINEYRDELGLDAIDGGDKPFILTGAGPIYLEHAEEQGELALEGQKIGNDGAAAAIDTKAEEKPTPVNKEDKPDMTKYALGNGVASQSVEQYAYLDPDKIPHAFGGEYSYLAVGDGITRKEYTEAQLRFTKAAQLAYSLATPEMVMQETELKMVEYTGNLREAIDRITLKIEKNANAIFGVVNHYQQLGTQVEALYTVYQYTIPMDKPGSSPLEGDEVTKSNITTSIQHGVLESLTKQFTTKLQKRLVKMLPTLEEYIPGTTEKDHISHRAAGISEDDDLVQDLDSDEEAIIASAAKVGLMLGAAQLLKTAPKQRRAWLAEKLSTIEVNQMENLLRDRSLMMAKSVAVTLKDGARKMIARMSEEGKSTPEITKALKEFVGFDDAWRAKRIARTELRWAASKAASIQAKSAQATTKSWQLDGNPCEICKSNADAGTIGIDEQYPSGANDTSDSHVNCFCHDEYSFDNPLGE